MDVLAVRCANGVVGWGKQPLAHRMYQWVCGRDGFVVSMPTSLKDTERVALGIASHSTQLAGAIQQVVQLDL